MHTPHHHIALAFYRAHDLRLLGRTLVFTEAKLTPARLLVCQGPSGALVHEGHARLWRTLAPMRLGLVIVLLSEPGRDHCAARSGVLGILGVTCVCQVFGNDERRRKQSCYEPSRQKSGPCPEYTSRVHN
jgi:hypothetical protein